MEATKSKTASDMPLNPSRRIVTLKGALVVRSNGEGEVVLSIPGAPLTRQQEDLIRTLFPNTEALINKALDTEMLISVLSR